MFRHPTSSTTASHHQQSLAISSHLSSKLRYQSCRVPCGPRVKEMAHKGFHFSICSCRCPKNVDHVANNGLQIWPQGWSEICRWKVSEPNWRYWSHGCVGCGSLISSIASFLPQPWVTWAPDARRPLGIWQMTVESSTETNTCLGLDAAEVFPTAAAALPFFATEQPMTLSTTNHTTSGTAKVVPILSSRFQRCEGVPIGNFHGGGAPRTQRHSCHSRHSPTLRSCLDLSFAACLGSASAHETFSHQTFGSFQISSNHFKSFHQISNVLPFSSETARSAKSHESQTLLPSSEPYGRNPTPSPQTPRTPTLRPVGVHPQLNSFNVKNRLPSPTSRHCVTEWRDWRESTAHSIYIFFNTGLCGDESKFKPYGTTVCSLCLVYNYCGTQFSHPMWTLRLRLGGDLRHGQPRLRLCLGRLGRLGRFGRFGRFGLGHRRWALLFRHIVLCLIYLYTHTHILHYRAKESERKREGGRERGEKKNKYQLLLYHIPLYLAKETTETNAEEAVGTL